MLGWLRSKKTNDAWLAITLGASDVAYAIGRKPVAGKAAIGGYGVSRTDGAAANAERVIRENRLGGHRCETLLEPDEYQTILVEAPNVPPAELKSALRWRIKDLIDYPIDDATIDLLDIPPDPSAPAKSHSVYAVAAKNDVIRRCIQRFDDIGLPLTAIDIRETAQRNIAALYETAGRGLAMLYLDGDSGLLTVNCTEELYLVRRLEIGLEQLNQPSSGSGDDALDRLSLELQRSFDHFERQFGFVSVAELLLAPRPQEDRLAATLSDNLGIKVTSVELSDVLAFEGVDPPQAAVQWRLFYHFGAALRH